MALIISATDLGFYASWRFCPRCAWVRLHVKTLPYQSFPGIFSTIDRYNKLIVQNHFERDSAFPAWLRVLGEVEAYIAPPHWSRFNSLDPETGVTLRGEADGIFRMADGSYTIVDYKTARHTRSQRGMLPWYRVQLNAYAYIGERQGLSPVTRLALVYMEPMTGEDAARDPRLVDDLGFSMGFQANIVDVDLRPEEMIPPLLLKVREVGDMECPPVGRPGCKDCDALHALIEALADPP
ncbi:MAG: PD-(D/E)XK nuclease family protein [Dehalococcoidia bacterium]|nr:PD-(D/E)XK nuclease family protein [Dehalococcoidia bacterium]MDP6227014.1 PD-(D/E)XK nuclease family protein [Dehalococcoidia bacterium]MDP7083143.1 PD-(D/E)XK nuclease family protein [Dehalococcoidia bacterium]MDP7201696.1 PD-(D/E)XK nuclease family protein [Dehalococcoidia bacterium]MDP7509305.1 PD-(D/E)XK nuclease family protein [Dehalococcoidia bacterium]